jgi:integrase
MIDRIRRMFAWGVENEIVDVAIYQALKTVAGLRAGRTKAVETEHIKPVDGKIVEATLAECSPVVAAMIRLQLLTGARPGEICNLTPSMVNRSGKVWEARLIEHKSAWRGKERTIFIGPKAQKILLQFLLRDAHAPCFSPSESEVWRREKRHASRVTPD